MKNTSVDRASRDESGDVSLKEKQRGFHDQKEVFLILPYIFAGVI